MAPKNDGRKNQDHQQQQQQHQNQNDSNSGGVADVDADEQQNDADDDSYFEEIEAVNDSLDSLSSILDLIEKRTDDIKAQLLELLNSNKEIRQSLIEQNSKDSRAS